MSYRAVERVLRARIAPPTLKLVAVVLADCLNEKTRLLNPGLSKIADRAGVNRRQAQRYVRTLMDKGLLSVIGNAYGGAPGTTPHYRLHLDRFDSLGQTDGAEDTPTGGAQDIPEEGEDTSTGGVQDADGRRTGPGGVAYRAQTGGVQTTQTRKEPGRNQEVTGGAQTDAFPDAIPADAGSPSPGVVVLASKGSKKAKAPAKTAATWAAYSQAFAAKYGTDPIRTAKTNAQMAKVVDALGAEDAPQVAAFYIRHPSAFYASKVHDVGFLLNDLQKLRTEWRTGRMAPEGRKAEPEWRVRDREWIREAAGPYAAQRTKGARAVFDAETVDYTDTGGLTNAIAQR